MTAHFSTEKRPVRKAAPGQPDDAAGSWPLTESSESTLIQAAKMGDSVAFGKLIDRYYRSSVCKAYSILRNHDDAQDVVQEACAQAWKFLSQYTEKGSFAGWFGRIVSRQCLMLLRRERFARMVSIDEVFEPAHTHRLEVIDQQETAEDKCGGMQVNVVLLDEIGKLPVLFREALVMRDLHECAMRDIADQLGVSVAAAKSRLMRARAELKRRLVRHYGEKGRGTLVHRLERPRAAYVRAG